MSQELPFENIESLLPMDFFSLEVECPYAKESAKSGLFRSLPFLPDLSQYLFEEKFSDVSICWNEEGLLIDVEISKPFENSSFPDYTDGDSVELFIDTRDIKQAGFATKFCHHFVVLPSKVSEIQVQEVTKFRSEDSHALCDPSLITVKTQYGKKQYHMSITIPATCLHGYDPYAFSRLGFTYQVNRYRGEPQHFCVSSRYFDIMQNPSMWSSLKLIKS